MIKIGMIVTCIYVGAFSWQPSGEEYVKTVPMQCEVQVAGPVWNDLSHGYQHLYVNCEKGMKRWKLVKGSPINWRKYWTSTDYCYEH